MADKVYLGGVTDTVLHLESDGVIHIEERQDAAPILDYAHAARNHRFDANVCDGLMRHVAEVPMTMYIQWCRDAGVQLFSAEADLVLEKKLQDPQYIKLLAAPKVRDPRIIMKGLR
jgi:hypothetical protein